MIKTTIDVNYNELIGKSSTPLSGLTTEGLCEDAIGGGFSKRRPRTIDEYRLVFGEPIKIDKDQIQYKGLPLLFTVGQNSNFIKCQRTDFTKHYDYYRKSEPKECDSFSYKYRMDTGVKTLELAPNVFFSHLNNKNTDVKLPDAVSQQLRFSASKKELGMNLDLPFFIWFTENITGKNENRALGGLCYLFEHTRNSEFKPIIYYIDIYLSQIIK